MVLVNCRWMQKEVINNIEAIEYRGIQIFKHVKTEGMRIYFESKIADEVRDINKSSIMEYMLIIDAIMQIHGWDSLAISVLPVVNNNAFDGYKYTICRSEPVDCQMLLK